MPDAGPLDLRLYVAAAAPNSARAERNLKALLEEHGVRDYALEIVDCITEPRRALDDGILVTPTLLKVAPAPAQTLIGTLGNRAAVCAALGLLAADDHGGSGSG
jgi:circadian clock protein KaiB